MSKETNPNETIILRGVTLRRCKYEGGTIVVNGKARNLEIMWRLYITNIDSEEFDSVVARYFDSEDRYCPKWAKNTHVTECNLKTRYECPVQINGLEDAKMSDIIGGEDCTCNIKVIVKDGAIYPLAIKVVSNGAYENPFEDM